MKSESWLRNLTITGLFAIPFLVIPVTGSLFFPFISGKNFLFRIIVEIMFAAWAILALRDPKYRPRRSPLLYAYAAFMIVLAAADFAGLHPYRSFWSNFERMEGLISHLHLFAYFVVLVSMFKSEEWWRRWFNTSIGVSVFTVLYGLIQLAGGLQINQGGVRVDATFGNAIYFAVYLLFHIYLCVILMTRESTSKSARWVYGIIAALQLFLLYYTATRGAILGLLGSVVLVSFIFLFKSTGRARRIATGIVLGMFVFVSGFYSIRNTDFVQSSPTLRRFSNITNETTVLSRRYIYPLSFKGFLERPLLGWGQENYNVVFNKYYDPRLYAQEQWFDRSHNVFLDWLVAAGALGLAAYLGLFVAAFYLLYRTHHLTLTERVLFFGLLAAYFAQNVTVFDNLTSYLFFFAVLGHIHFHATRDQQDRSHAHDGRLVGVSYGPQVVAAVILLPILYYANIKPMIAGARLIDAMQIRPETGIAGSLERFKRVFDANTFASPEAREQLVQIAMRVAQASDVPPQDRIAFLDYARQQVLAQVAMYPDDARYRLFAGGFFTRVGLNDEGIAQLEKAVELSPKKQTLLFELASAHINKKQFDRSLEILQKAYELEPSFEEARRLYGLGLIYAGKDKEAAAILQLPGGGILVDDDRFVQAYLERKRYDLVAAVWRIRVKNNPESARNHLGLATSLWADKKYTEARAELKKANELDPSIKVEEYLKLFREQLGG